MIYGQSNDCTGARIVCDNSNISLNPQGPGFDDYTDVDNDPGCLVDGENNTTWYYFEIDEAAPTSLELGFIIDPNGGLGEDYDWALYGPGALCHKLGTPVRCSSSSAQCGFCPETGMGMGTTDITEGPGSGDGFVMTLQVQPGQGFFLVIDNWQGTNNGFVLTWTGTAAPFLDCDAEVPCSIIADAGEDMTICGGDPGPFQLDGSSTNNNGNETYRWSGTNGGTSFLSNPDIEDPFIQLPPEFTGNITYTLSVNEDSCRNTDIVSVFVTLPDVSINPLGPFCENSSVRQLSATPPGGTWGGSVNNNMFDPMQLGPGIHTVTYSYTDDDPPCTNTDSINIEVFVAFGTTISAGQDIVVPLGDQASIEVTSNVTADQIDTVIWSPAGIVECFDAACLNVLVSPVNDVTLVATAIDINGCSASDELQIVVTKDRQIYIPNIFSPNDDGVNDHFFISGNLKQIARVKRMAIYNRWGALVYEAHDFVPDDLSKAWNGDGGDQSLDPGVYAYGIEVEFIDGWIQGFEGDITLIR